MFDPRCQVAMFESGGLLLCCKVMGCAVKKWRFLAGACRYGSCGETEGERAARRSGSVGMRVSDFGGCWLSLNALATTTEVALARHAMHANDSPVVRGWEDNIVSERLEGAYATTNQD